MKEEKKLVDEEEELRTLEKNAADGETIRKARYSHLHPLAKDIGQNIDDIDILRLCKQDFSSLTALHRDPETRPILEQLENHLSSISSNVTSIEAVSLGLEKAREELTAATNT